MGWVSIGITLAKAAWELYKWIKSHKNPQAALAAFSDAHDDLMSTRCDGVGCPAQLVKE